MAMDENERKRLRGVRDRFCAPRGCKCVRECFRAWGRFWAEKAVVCTHPNWATAEDGR